MKRLAKLAVIASAPAALMSTATPASAGVDEYLGELMLVGYNFCPRGSFEANGALLPIASWQALFSLYGTTFGGDGRTSFGLPDLRGRSPIGQGSGPGLPPVQWGERSGSTSFTLNVTQMPSHNHTGEVRSENAVQADTGNPAGNAIARSTLTIYSNNSPPTAAGAMHPGTLFINNTGGNQPVDKRSPYLGMRYCVVNSGIYPSRN